MISIVFGHFFALFQQRLYRGAFLCDDLIGVIGVHLRYRGKYAALSLAQGGVGAWLAESRLLVQHLC